MAARHRLYVDADGRTCLDPDGRHYGLPAYGWGDAPPGLATCRQLRAWGLRPGGHDPVAMLVRPRRRRPSEPLIAYLYRVDLAAPKRAATAAQQAAIGRALLARRTCPTCGQVRSYYIPRSLGECLDCADAITAA